jgi:hypothetical protein
VGTWLDASSEGVVGLGVTKIILRVGLIIEDCGAETNKQVDEITQLYHLTGAIGHPSGEAQAVRCRVTEQIHSKRNCFE